MKKTLKRHLILCLTIGCTIFSYAQRKAKVQNKTIAFPMTEKHWASVSTNVEFASYKSTKVARSMNESDISIMLKDFVFTTGIIEFDVELKGQGFPGINFRIGKDSLNSEIFYLRHSGKPDPKRRTTLQYAPVISGVNLWDLTDDYQAAASLYENQWNHVKMVVSEKQMKVYVNDMEKAALWVPALEGITKSGSIGLTGNVIYANMEITPNATGDLPATAGYESTYNDPNYLRNWQITEPIDFTFGKDILTGIQRNPGVAIDPVYLDSTAIWRPIEAGRRALVNLTKEFGGESVGPRRLIWLKTTVTSDKIQEKSLKLGFSDEVYIFINGQPLYKDENYFGSPGMKEPRGRATLDNTSFEIPFKKGENEILIGLTNYFYGWGLIARLADTDGLDY